MTDTLQAIAENTAVPAAWFTNGEAGKAMTKRWSERDKPAAKNNRTGAEIVADVVEKAGLIVRTDRGEPR